MIYETNSPEETFAIAKRLGEQAQPGALGKGIGLIVGGAVLCALKAIVTAVIGSDPTTMTFY